MKNFILLSLLFLSGMVAKAQTCSAPISMEIVNSSTYRFYTDTLPGIQSYAWVVTTFVADTATSSGSFSSQEAAYFSPSTFNSPDYIQVCLELSFADGCVASSCDTFIYCDAGFTYTIDNQYGLTLTPDFPAGYMNELHYWTLTGPGIPNPTQTNEVSTYYIAPGQEYTACQQLMVTSTGCIANECQVITIPSNVTPECDASFTYSYLPTNGAISVNSDYYPSLGNFQHTYTATSYLNNNTTSTNTQNNGGYFFVVSADAYAVEICHTITNLNTGCSATECEFLNLCTAEFSYDTSGNACIFTAGGIGTIASHNWTINATLADGSMNSQTLSGPIATWVVPAGASSAVVCHDVTSNNAVLNCGANFCDTLYFCNASFTYTSNPNSTVTVVANNAISDGSTFTWLVDGQGYPSVNYTTPSFSFTPLPNQPYSVCLTYQDVAGCFASSCDTIQINTCNAEFTLSYNNSILSGTPEAPYASGNIYSWTINSSNYGAGSYSGPNLMYTLPADAGIVSVCLNIVNTFTGCNAVFCDSLQLPTINCSAFCAAEILPGPDSATAMLVNLFFNGLNTDFINYPYVTAITSITGDTLATGSMNYFGQIGGTQQLYSVFSVDGNALPNNFNGYVHFTYDNQTCVLPYPCVPTCNATFTWVDNGNGTITTAAAPYVSGNEYTWVLTEGSGGVATTYNNFGNITLTLVPGEQYALCLTLSNVLSNCSNEYCTSVSVPATASCNAEFTYTGPLPIDNSYQFIGVMNDTAAYHEWTFGDGTSSALDMPFHSFASSGMYEVCHIVGISGVCSDTICYTANFIGNNSTGLYIAGEVNAGANVPDLGSVKLFSLDTLSNSVALIAQVTLSNSGSYYFGGLSTGIYLIKAGLSSSSSYYGDYVPTYFGSQFYWFDAEPVFLTESGDNYNISLIYAGNGGGPGSVSGSIDDGPYRLMDPESAGVESANPVAGADVIVTNLSGNPQRWIDADNSGNYSISNLDYGTYRLMADEPGMLCVPIEFTISPDFPSIFIDLVMGEELTGIEANSQVLSVGDVYPNPSPSNTYITLNSSSADEISIQVIGLDGKIVFQSTKPIVGNSVIEIPSSTFANGMYFMRLTAKENAATVNRKLQMVR